MSFKLYVVNLHKLTSTYVVSDVLLHDVRVVSDRSVAGCIGHRLRLIRIIFSLNFFVSQDNMGKLRYRWVEKNMKEAVEKVRTKEMTIREESERYSVPKSTLVKIV